MSAESVRILIIDDDRALAEVIAESLARQKHDCAVATSGKQGSQLLRDGEYDVILTDLRMAGIDGLAIVKQARELQPDAEVYVITGYGDVRTAVEAMRLGAAHYLMKPIDQGELRAIMEQASKRVALARSNRDLRRQLDEKFGYEGVVGSGPKMSRVVQLLKAYAPSPAPILILGENGTGKELAAKALHNNSPRKSKPFIAMNCAALNENLLDDDLFGHEEGAYTGAKGARKGRFEHAHQGTLFLDEVGDMPLGLQAKILRVLENGEVVRIGANDPVRVDVRLLAATNQNLEQMVEDGKFRRDLYHRLKVGVVRLPPLRERREDIPLLLNHFLKELAAKYSRQNLTLAEPLRNALIAHPWPGNVRELRNTLESLVVLDTDSRLDWDDVPDDAGLGISHETKPGAGADGLVGRPIEEVERYYIERALELAGGNREAAAAALKISERTLYRKLQEWKKHSEAPA